MKKIIAILLALCVVAGIVFIFIGRNSGKDNPGSDSGADVQIEALNTFTGSAQAIYAVETLDGPKAWMGYTLAVDGDYVYFSGNYMEDRYIYRCGRDGANIREFAVFRDETVWDLCAYDGTVYVLTERVIEHEDGTEEAVNSLVELYGMEPSRRSTTLGGEGWPTDMWPTQIVHSQGMLYIAGSGYLCGLDPNDVSKPVFTVEIDPGAELDVLPDGSVVIGESRDGGFALYTVDSQGNFGPEKFFNMGFMRMSGGGERWSLYLSDGSNLYGYDYTSDSLSKILSWASSGMPAGNAVLETGESDFLCLGKLSSMEASPLLRLKKTDLDPNGGENGPVTLTLATLDSSTVSIFLGDLIHAWNREHPECLVEIRDYSIYADEIDPSAAQLRLLTDIASGDAPDMYDFSSFRFDRSDWTEPFSVGQLARRGFLENIYPYIDADEDFDREDFLENVHAALEIDGELYEVVGSVSLLTSCGNVQEIGDNPSLWTYDGLNSALTESDRARVIFCDTTFSDDLLEVLVSGSGDKLVDWGAGACYFDSDYFMSILKTVKAQRDTGIEIEPNEAWQMDINGALLVLYNDPTLSFTSSWFTFGPDNYRHIGLPEVGLIVSPEISCGISSFSAHKQECWDFLKSLYTGSNVSSSVYKERQQESKEFRLTEYSEGMAARGMTEAQYTEYIEKTYALLSSARYAYRYDPQIWQIVHAGAEAYFAGQRSVEDTARLIQSRVSIYLAEQGG